ncbi:MAG: nicotinate (nicotinamide) nucleotide adenylyltransferase [Deltaproteobacteria bacterium]|jgi:nicotinate-nucleotide adenylyltransferase|nr:nicotinate (nicotinamide) nucleotide adenylyltransferase [Deltaproteobacteria bacterium]
MTRIGLFGGTFDPIHFGHLRVAEELFYHLKLAQVLFIPAAQQPHKDIHGPVDFRHRLEMLKLAIEDRPGFSASDIEKDLPRPSYTVNTIRALKQKYAEELIFMVGFDSFSQIKKWRGHQELLALAPLAVFRRPGAEVDRTTLKTLLTEVVGAAPTWEPDLAAFSWPNRPLIYYYEGSSLYISSTDLRARLATGQSVRYLLPESVRQYLTQEGLYAPKLK